MKNNKAAKISMKSNNKKKSAKPRNGSNGVKIDKVLLTIHEVAEIFNLSKFTVYRMLKDGDLQATKIRGSIRVFGNSLERYISDNTIVQP